MNRAGEFLLTGGSESKAVTIFMLLTRNGEKYLYRCLRLFLSNGDNSFPSEFINDGFTVLKQKIAKKSNCLNQIGFSGSAAANEYCNGIKLKIEFTDALEVANFDPLDHKISKEWRICVIGAKENCRSSLSFSVSRRCKHFTRPTLVEREVDPALERGLVLARENGKGAG